MENTTKSLSDKYIMNTYGRFDVEIKSGCGVYVYDENDKKYLDFASGIAVNSLGYADEDCINAVVEQVKKFNHCSNLYYSEPQVKVAKLLVENSCFDKVFFCNSGTEAMEAMLKIARKFGKTKNQNCSKIITMKNSFHGRTLGALTATGQAKYQEAFTPLIGNIVYAEFNNLESVKELISDEVCAVIVEPFQGEGGMLPSTKEFLSGLRALCDENNILLGFDEVQCGVGRLGTLFAYQKYSVEPDMVAMAKGLATGLPIGACAAKGVASTVLERGDHGSTFGGNPISCASAEVVLTKLTQGKILENVQIVGTYLKLELEKLASKYDFIKEVRGIGFMIGMELTFEAKDVLSSCLQKGLLLIGAGKNIIRFTPPLIISKDNVDEMILILDGVLSEV